MPDRTHLLLGGLVALGLALTGLAAVPTPSHAATPVCALACDTLDRLGRRWAGTTPDQTDWRTQASALAALTASPRVASRAG